MVTHEIYVVYGFVLNRLHVTFDKYDNCHSFFRNLTTERKKMMVIYTVVGDFDAVGSAWKT